MTTNLGNLPNMGSEEEKALIQSARRGLIVYFAMLIPLTILSYVLMMRTPMFGLLLMWAPGLSSIFARLVLREGISNISLRFGGKQTLKSLPFILLFPVVIGLLAYGTAWITGLVQYVNPDSIIQGSSGVIFAGTILFQMFAGTAIGIISSSGEELGWRGYMLTRLINAGVPRPILTSGIIWGVWHLPAMLFANYYSGPYLALSVMLFMISVTSFSYLISHLRLTTGSIWPAILLHACWNAVIQGAFDVSSSGKNALLWTGESGIFVALALLITAWIISRRSTFLRQL